MSGCFHGLHLARIKRARQGLILTTGIFVVLNARMARPKEKESSACNLKLEIGSKHRLTALAQLYKTSRTKVVEELVDERHRREFAPPGSVKADATASLAKRLMEAIEPPRRAARSRT